MEAHTTCESSWAPWGTSPAPVPLQSDCRPAIIDDDFRAACESLLQEDDAVVIQGPGFANPIPASPSHQSAAMLLQCPKRDSNEDSTLQIACLHTTSPQLPQQFQMKLEDCAAAKHSHRQVKVKTKEAEKQLQVLAKHYADAEAENARLKDLDKKLSACVQTADFQKRLSDIVHRGPRRPQPVPASCSQVSFSELPPSSQWDAPWVARIKALRPQDLLVLRRQWAQQSAVLLPQAQVYGPNSDAYKTMERLHHKHLDLVRALLALAPNVWLESSQYDMDTLQPVKAPTAEWVRDLFMHLCPRENWPLLYKLGAEYHTSSSSLQGEYRTLLQRYKSLAHDLDLQQPLDLGTGDDGAAGPSGSWDRCFGFGAVSSQLSSVSKRLRLDCPPAFLDALQQLDDTALLLQANISRQRVAVLKLFTALYRRFEPKNFNFVLMMYPLACTSVDFVPGFLLLGDAAGPAPSLPPAAPRA